MRTLVSLFLCIVLFPVFSQTIHEFSQLPYTYAALEPYIDAKTVEIHYDKHHRAYFNNFINAIKGTELEKIPVENIFKQMSKYDSGIRNNAGGWYNHTLYWNIMIPGGSKQPVGELAEKINITFGSYEKLKDLMNEAGMKRFGSGWVWLSVDADGKLFVSSTANQDNPLMDVVDKQGIPILGIDVWEHAYYLKYQNMRKSYLEAFWNLVNWDEVAKLYNRTK